MVSKTVDVMAGHDFIEKSSLWLGMALKLGVMVGYGLLICICVNSKAVRFCVEKELTLIFLTIFEVEFSCLRSPLLDFTD